MPISIKCDACQDVYTVKDEWYARYQGRMMHCHYCEKQMLVHEYEPEWAKKYKPKPTPKPRPKPKVKSKRISANLLLLASSVFISIIGVGVLFAIGGFTSAEGLNFSNFKAAEKSFKIKVNSFMEKVNPTDQIEIYLEHQFRKRRHEITDVKFYIQASSEPDVSYKATLKFVEKQSVTKPHYTEKEASEDEQLKQYDSDPMTGEMTVSTYKHTHSYSFKEGIWQVTKKKMSYSAEGALTMPAPPKDCGINHPICGQEKQNDTSKNR